MGQVCARHTQYYEERCPYCEEPEAVGLHAAMPDGSIFGIMSLPSNYALSPQATANQGFSINHDNYHFWRGIQPQQQMTSRQIQDAMNKAWAQVMSNEQDPNDGHGAFE